MRKTTAAAALVLAFSSMAMSAARAEIVTYFFADSGLYNGIGVNNTGVFATASFTDVAAANGNIGYVELVMSVDSALQTHAYVNDWAFNSDDIAFNADHLSGEVAKSFKIGSNVVNNFGGTSNLNDFDLGFSFSNGDGQLAAGATSTYKLIGTGLSASSFKTANAIDIFSAVHVQGYGNGTSSFYKGVTVVDTINPPSEVPEPGTVALFGLGLLGFAAARRKAGKRQAA